VRISIHFATLKEIVKILVSLTDYPNDPGKDGHSQSYFAAKNGNSEIV